MLAPWHEHATAPLKPCGASYRTERNATSMRHPLQSEQGCAPPSPVGEPSVAGDGVRSAL